MEEEELILRIEKDSSGVSSFQITGWYTKEKDHMVDFLIAEKFPIIRKFDTDDLTEGVLECWGDFSAEKLQEYLQKVGFTVELET